MTTTTIYNGSCPAGSFSQTGQTPGGAVEGALFLDYSALPNNGSLSGQVLTGPTSTGPWRVAATFQATIAGTTQLPINLDVWVQVSASNSKSFNPIIVNLLTE